MTIVEFLNARYGEAEAFALAAKAEESGQWHVGEDPHGEYLSVLGFFGRDYPPPLPVDVMCGDWYAVAEWSWDVLDQMGLDFSSVRPSVEHIATNDPASVLADIAAKRAIITNYRYLADGTGPLSDELAGQLKAYGWAVAHLASVYSSHPDYDETWAV